MSWIYQAFLNWFRNSFFKKEIEISIIGLQNAGKTTFVNSMTTGKFDQDTIPTIGVNIRNMKKGNVSLRLWDLGGQPRYRDSWEKYCSSSDCIIYIVDASDRENIDVARTMLHDLLKWQSVDGIPLLVLGNKNDIKDCLNEEEMIELLDLKNLAGRKVCCYSISAKNMTNLDIAFKWLNDLQKIAK